MTTNHFMMAERLLADSPTEQEVFRAQVHAILASIQHSQEAIRILNDGQRNRESNPLDENDHRDRLLADGTPLMRSVRGHWHTSLDHCQRDCASMPDPDSELTLALWDKDFGPLSFAPAAPAQPDPLDESDHRDRLDKNGYIVRRKGHECWAWPEFSGFHSADAGEPLSSIDAGVFGPLTFAPKEPPNLPDPGPLDENDHRDRLDGDGSRWCRRESGMWYTPDFPREPEATLAEVAENYGPLFFASEELLPTPEEDAEQEEVEPDPLDENDHRDRLRAYGERIVRVGHKHWHIPERADCRRGEHGWSLEDWNTFGGGPLSFAPDTPAPQEDAEREEVKPDPLDENDHRDRLAQLSSSRVRQLIRRENGHWHTGDYKCPDWCFASDDFSLAGWAQDAILTFAPEESPDQPDPLDENDHRDRLDKNGDIVRRKGYEFWSWPGVPGFHNDDVGWSLRSLNAGVFGPLSFAPEESPSTQSGAEETADVEHSNRAINCHECGHNIDWHLDQNLDDETCDAAGCTCSLRPSDIARHLIAQATS